MLTPIGRILRGLFIGIFCVSLAWAIPASAQCSAPRPHATPNANRDGHPTHSAPRGIQPDGPNQPGSSFDCNQPIDVTPPECQALVLLYDEAGGSNWFNRSGWAVTTTIGDWYGVTVTGGHVTALALRSDSLRGNLPAEIGDLPDLQTLDLGSCVACATPNRIGGPLPPELGNLSSLQALALDHNAITGTIPAELGNLGNLQKLGLEFNALTGTIPTTLGNLSELQEFTAFNNQLSGGIPPELGTLLNLQTLNLSGNRLSGPLPAEPWARWAGCSTSTWPTTA